MDSKVWMLNNFLLKNLIILKREISLWSDDASDPTMRIHSETNRKLFGRPWWKHLNYSDWIIKLKAKLNYTFWIHKLGCFQLKCFQLSTNALMHSMKSTEKYSVSPVTGLQFDELKTPWTRPASPKECRGSDRTFLKLVKKQLLSNSVLDRTVVISANRIKLILFSWFLIKLKTCLSGFKTDSETE